MTEMLAVAHKRSLLVGLLEIRDPELRGYLLSTFDRARDLADRGEIDVVILAARRLACVYQALLSLGMEQLPCEVVSDRVLDLDARSHLTGRSVLIIDDCVILGRTLTSLVARARSAVGDQGAVQTVALCADQDQSDTALLKRLSVQVCASRSTPVAQEFSLDLARLLFHNLVPYFADFPATRRISLPPLGYKHLFEMKGWTAVDTTAARLRRPGLASYSFVPTGARERSIRRKLGRSLSSISSVLKVRVIIDSDESGDRLVAIPIALLDSLDIQAVNTLLGRVSDVLHMKTETGTNWQTWNADAKYRLLQMFVSVLLLREFWVDLRKLGTIPTLKPSTIDPSLIDLHFGERMAEAIEKTLFAALLFKPSQPLQEPFSAAADVPASRAESDTDLLRLRALGSRFMQVAPDLPVPARDQLGRTGETLVTPIAQIFGFVGELEDAERARLKKSSSKGDGFRWLNEGVRLDWLSDCLGGEDSKLVATYVIDTLNDLGVAVPTTHFDSRSGALSRWYRIGENVYLANEILKPHGRGTSWKQSRELWMVSHFYPRVDDLVRAVVTEWPQDRVDVSEAFGALLTERRTIGRDRTKA